MWYLLLSMILLVILNLILELRRIFVLITVKGLSMNPTLVPGNRIVMARTHSASSLLRGQVVIVAPWDIPQRRILPPSSRLFIKRIVGMPGDTIITDLNELHPTSRESERVHYTSEGCRTWVIPPEHYFVCGDYPEAANDSRIWGPIHQRQVVGIACGLERKFTPPPYILR